MANFSFGTTSTKRLQTCHIDLQALLHEVMDKTQIDFTVCCGHRGEEEQEAAFDAGNSKAHFGESPHNCRPAMAFDIAPYYDGKLQWDDIDAFEELAELVKECARDLKSRRIIGDDIVWGGDFHSFKDRPHFELKNWKDDKGDGW